MLIINTVHNKFCLRASQTTYRAVMNILVIFMCKIDFIKIIICIFNCFFVYCFVSHIGIGETIFIFVITTTVYYT